jgi:hypothetical protein
MKLASQVPGMVCQLHDFHQLMVRRCPGNDQSGFFQTFLVHIVEFIPMAVPL